MLCSPTWQLVTWLIGEKYGLHACFHSTSSCNIFLKFNMEFKEKNCKIFFCLKSGRDRNETEEQDALEERFYGPPSNCSELSKLGFTLNGYYIVKGSKNSSQIEIVLCRFRLPPGENESNRDTLSNLINSFITNFEGINFYLGAKEERIGFISLDQITSKTYQLQSI